MTASQTDTPINGERFKACREFQCPPSVPSGILMLSPAKASEVENTQQEGKVSVGESGEVWHWMSVLECHYFSNFVAQPLASLPQHC